MSPKIRKSENVVPRPIGVFVNRSLSGFRHFKLSKMGLMRHEESLGKNPRMAMQFRNLARLDRPRRVAIRKQAEETRAGFLRT